VKAAGVYKDRPASIDAAQVRAMKARGLALRRSRRPLTSAGRRYIGYWKPDDPTTSRPWEATTNRVSLRPSPLRVRWCFLRYRWGLDVGAVEFGKIERGLVTYGDDTGLVVIIGTGVPAALHL
jgi:hypothetical protein